MALVGWLHAQLFRLCLWLLRQAGRSLWYTVGAVLALLGEEARRYTGLALWGVVILLAGRAVLNYAPEPVKLPLVLTVLALVVVWGLAVLRSLRFTRRNNLQAVRQRRFFRELRGEVGQLGTTVRAGLGRRARGTPIEGFWKSNREDRDREAAEAEAAAAQAERERAEAAAWEEAVAAKRAEREQFAAAAAARRRDAS